MKQQQLPTTEQQPPQPALKRENAVSTWMHRITVAIFWIAFGSFLATSIPHVAWLYSTFEPQDGWHEIPSYGVAVGIDVMIGWLSFVQTMGRGREVWFTWVFISLLGALSWYANYLYDMKFSPVAQADIWNISILWGHTTTGYITPILTSAVPIFAVAYTLMLSKLREQKVESIDEMKARLVDLKQRRAVEQEIKTLKKGRVKNALTAAIDDSVEVLNHARTRVRKDVQSVDNTDDETASTSDEPMTDETINSGSIHEAEDAQSAFNPRTNEDVPYDDDPVWRSLSSRASVSVEKAAELLGLTPNYVRSLRGKALKTAPRNKEQITIASIKRYKARQAKRLQSVKGKAMSTPFTVVPGTRVEGDNDQSLNHDEPISMSETEALS